MYIKLLKLIREPSKCVDTVIQYRKIYKFITVHGDWKKTRVTLLIVYFDCKKHLVEIVKFIINLKFIVTLSQYYMYVFTIIIFLLSTSNYFTIKLKYRNRISSRFFYNIYLPPPPSTIYHNLMCLHPFRQLCKKVCSKLYLDTFFFYQCIINIWPTRLLMMH